MDGRLASWREGVRRWLKQPRVLWRGGSAEVAASVEIRQVTPLAAFALALIWQLASPSPVALMSVVALGGALLAGFLWAWRQARSVRGERRLRFAAMQVGDELEEQITLRNHTFLPVVWAEYVDRSNIPGYTVSSARAADPREVVQWRAHTICTRRGIFNLGPWELRIGEPFGFFQARQIYLQRQEILVYPALAELPEQVLPHHGAAGDQLPLNQPLRAETIAPYSVRGYAPGDPLRHIHWRTTARRDAPFVKVFAPEAASRVWLLPDFDAAAHAGSGDGSSQEYMVTVIASLAAALLQQNLAVGLFASAEREALALPRQGQPYLWTLLQAIAPLHTVADHPLAGVLARVKPLLSASDLLLVVTPSLRPEWPAALRQIAFSRGSRGRAEVVLLDRASFAGVASSGDGGEEAAARFNRLLWEQGIPTHVLRREDIRVISGYYGQLSRWEFIVMGTGKAVARSTPRAAPGLGMTENG